MSDTVPENSTEKSPGFIDKLLDKLDIFKGTEKALGDLKKQIEDSWPMKAWNFVKGMFGVGDNKSTENDAQVEQYDAKVSFPDSVVEKIKPTAKLSQGQLNNAKIIEEEFRQAGLSKELAAAAIVNAYRESGLNHLAIGDGGNSIGLFQLHIRGGGAGMSKEERQNPRLNTQRIIKEVKEGGGKNLLSADKRGTSIAELAVIFMRDIERPKNQERGAANCRAKTSELFG